MFKNGEVSGLSSSRRERERETIKDLILGAASELAAQEGLESLSIRKIASKIEYSPATIYHYFKDKEEIVDILLQRGYQRIITALRSAQVPDRDPEQRLKGIARNYINMALEHKEDYKAFLLSSSPTILDQTAVLFAGASSKRPTIAMACQDIRALYEGQEVTPEFVEQTAQVVWASAFGLALRMIVENTPPEQAEKLIDRHVEFMAAALRPRRPQ